MLRAHGDPQDVLTEMARARVAILGRDEGMVGAERGAGDAQSFGSLLRQHRLATGLTREQLAERAGLGVRSIQDLERGIGRALRRTAAALAAALGLEPEALAAFRLAAAPGPRGHPIRPLAAAHGRPAG